MPVYPKEITREFIDKANRREAQGLSTYGDFVPETDKRILAVEAQEEVLDAFVYGEFEIRKHPSLKPLVRKMQVKACVLYHLLKDLEAKEIALNAKKEGVIRDP